MVLSLYVYVSIRKCEKSIGTARIYNIIGLITNIQIIWEVTYKLYNVINCWLYDDVWWWGYKYMLYILKSSYCSYYFILITKSIDEILY